MEFYEIDLAGFSAFSYTAPQGNKCTSFANPGPMGCTTTTINFKGTPLGSGICEQNANQFTKLKLNRNVAIKQVK